MGGPVGASTRSGLALPSGLLQALRALDEALSDGVEPSALRM
jgi:hypothetical protein